MLLKNKARRSALLDAIIADTALDYRFSEDSQPRMSEDTKAAADDAIARWNRCADEIDKWAAQKRKFANGYIGLRLHWSGAFACQFRQTEKAIRAGAQLPAAYWRAIGVLDDLAEHLPRGRTKLTVPPILIRWMADFIFLSMIPAKMLDRAAHQKGHIWDRRLRHTKRAKARKTQAFMAETALAIEDTQQEAEFELMLRDVVRRHRKMQADVRKDRIRSGDIDVAPPQIKVIRLKDRKSVMLMPPFKGGRRILPAKPQE
jgi:hypothetical protein